MDDDYTLLDVVERAAELWRKARSVVMLTGAGVSTESGIPDFRSPGGLWSTYKPIYYLDFMRKAEVRAAFWLRSQVTFPTFLRALPNAAHRTIAGLQQAGKLAALITQNVDGLHGLAGSDALELHGNYLAVVCTACGSPTDRPTVLQHMAEMNEIPAYLSEQQREQIDPTSVRVPGCELCDGILKPGVVFFGENVPVADAQQSLDLAAAADLCVVVGSSLAVYSGYRIPLRAAQAGAKTIILSLGPTRFDDRAALLIRARAGNLLPMLAARLLLALHLV